MQERMVFLTGEKLKTVLANGHSYTNGRQGFKEGISVFPLQYFE
jgi:hypothetical protein